MVEFIIYEKKPPDHIIPILICDQSEVRRKIREIAKSPKNEKRYGSVIVKHIKNPESLLDKKIKKSDLM